MHNFIFLFLASAFALFPMQSDTSAGAELPIAHPISQNEIRTHIDQETGLLEIELGEKWQTGTLILFAPDGAQLLELAYFEESVLMMELEEPGFYLLKIKTMEDEYKTWVERHSSTSPAQS